MYTKKVFNNLNKNNTVKDFNYIIISLLEHFISKQLGILIIPGRNKCILKRFSNNLNINKTVQDLKYVTIYLFDHGNTVGI